jgi:hypothetical protein
MRKKLALVVAVVFVICVYAIAYAGLGFSPLSHNSIDSYTRQAIQWTHGKTFLDEDVSYLELAFFKDKYFVSFPPFPSVVELVLVPFFGQNTPNNLLSTLYTFGSMAALIALAIRFKRPLEEALFWGVTTPLACNLFTFSFYGSVWFAAQTLAFFLSALSLLCITSPKQKHWHLSVLLWALSIACRPLNIVFGPVLYFFIYSRLKGIKASIPFLILPLLIGSIIGWYNYIRFESPFEFGHIYLPIHTTTGDPQFSPNYIVTNVGNILRLPILKEGKLEFPIFGGFAFYIANPIFVMLFVRLFKHRKDLAKKPLVLVTLFSIALHFFLNTMHHSFGAFQFGTRILVDAVPLILFTMFLLDPKLKKIDVALTVFGIVLNMYGAYYMYVNW